MVQAAFVADDVSNIIKESIDAVVQNQQYHHAKVRFFDHVNMKLTNECVFVRGKLQPAPSVGDEFN